MADDVRNDQTRSISATGSDQTTTRNKKRQTKTRTSKENQEAKNQEKNKSSLASSPEEPNKVKEKTRSKNKRKLKESASKESVVTAPTKRNKRKASKTSLDSEVPGPSGLNKQQNSVEDIPETSSASTQEKNITDNKPSASSSKSKSKRKSAKKNPIERKSTRSASESNVTVSTSPKKAALKKTKSDTVVTNTKQGQKRKAKKYPVFSPKKLRSSTHQPTTTNSQPGQKSAKTGPRLSRTGNPPEVDEPTGGNSENKLGSCASRRRNRRTRTQREAPVMESERNGNSSTQESTTTNEEGQENNTEGPLVGAIASLSASASSSGNNDTDLAASLEEGDMTRLQALLEARGLPAHLFGSLGPRMHLLLHKTFNSGAGAKAQQLLTSMQNEDEGTQLQGVMEMCQLLVMGNEETLGGFPVKQVVPVLITLLKMEHNFDIMNHACRALTYLMEGLPRSSVVVIDAVPMLLEKLQTIQCMDVAEQSLTALEMLSKRHGKNILQAGGLGSSLLFLDFFSIVAQRSALAITANCCHSVNVDDFQYVRNSIQILSGRLLNQDKKSLESVCLAFARLVDNVQKDKKLLEELCEHNLLANLKQLLIISPPLVNSGTFVMVIRMLGIMCANCPSIAVQLLKLNITETLRYILIGSNNVPTDEIVELVPRSPQELYELITLICELLPNLPNTGIFSIDSYLRKGNSQNSQTGTWQWKDDRSAWHTYMWVDNRIIEAAYQGGEDEISLSTLGRNYTIDFANMQQINEDTGTIRSIQRKTGNGSFSVPPQKPAEKTEDERSIIFNEEKDIGKEMVQSLIAVVFDVYYSSVGPYVKHKCLNSVLKMLYHSPNNLLEEVLSKIPISSYIAGMLSSQDVRIVCSALQKADILMSKLSDTFHVYFRREGVMHRVKRLADGELSPTKGSSSSSSNSPNKNNASAEETKHAQAVGSSSSSSKKTSEQGKGFDDISSMQESSNEVTSSTSKLASLRNRKKGLKKFTRGSKSSTNNKTTDESPPSSLRTKRLSHEAMRPKSSTFSGASHSASTGNVASKASFFASFAPRWGRSQSLQSTTVSGSAEKTLKENIGKEQEQNREKIRTWIRKTAQDFYTKYFAEQTGNSHPALNILLKLTAASEQLTSNGDSDRTALESIREVLLTEDFRDGASPFEMVHSGMVTSLLKYLTSKAGKKDEVSRTTRVKTFLTIFLGLSNINDSTLSSHIQVSSKPTLVSLVQKLNLCINQLEQFPVKCQDIPGSGVAGGSRGSSALRFFNTHQIKCNLQRHPDYSNVKQWCGGAVKIDPLALVQAIERYLVVRGYGRVREDIDSEMSDDEDRSEDEIEECWASQLQISNNPKHILEFTMNGHVLPYNMTVYQAVRQYAKANHDDDSELDEDSGPFGRASIWSGTHTIYFKPISQSNENVQPSSSTSKRSKSDSHQASSSSKSVPHKCNASTDISTQTDSPFLTDALPGDFASSDPSVTVICLLRVLYYLNSNWRKFFDLQASHPVVSLLEFVNTKLTAKATRQLQDPLVIMTGNLPSWLAELAKACPFIFPFECRQLLFYTTTFDRDRAVMKLQETVPDLASTESSDRVAPRLDKKKRTVSRGDLFKQAENVFTEFTNSRSLLEIQYEGEVGTGLGPTLEFYSLVSKEFQRADLEMWRGDCVEVVDGEGDSKKNLKYAYSRDGLFPAVVHKNTKSAQLSKLKSKFRFLGKFMAKACTDSRMIDINFSETFYKWLVTLDHKFDICDMKHVDKTLYKSLSQLYEVVLHKKRIENDVTHTKDSLDLALSVLTLDGVPIEDLGLDFVLPGTNYELKKNGKDITVAIDNLEEYLQLVVQFTLIDGVSAQLQAFKEGFEQFFSLSSLQMFYPHEIDMLLCGSKSEKWEAKDLMDCCRADHGYTIDSRAVKFLFEILSKYDPEQQRSFLQFITGSPNLPVGGFKSLNPPLTIVRKTVDSMSNPDFYLPSVMTCVNYLKLPDYSSVDVMGEKLRTAYLEGKNAFHLS